MKNNNIELYIWSEKYLGNKQKIDNQFSPLIIKVDQKAAIGAGASGLLPELGLLLVVATALNVATGFLNAVGADAWEIIKKGISKLADRKPDRKDLSVPHYKGPVQYELIWWIYFEDIKILIIIGLSSEEEVVVALNYLPESINSAFKDGTEFSRLMWNGKSWNKY